MWPSKLDPVVYVGFQDRPHPTRAAPLSQGPSPVRRTRRERYGHARRREPCTRPESSLAAKRPHERCRSRGLRLAAGLRSLDRRCVPRYSRRPVPALGLYSRHVEAELQLLHPGVARRPAAGGRAQAVDVPPLRGAGGSHRPHAVAVARALDPAHGHPPVASRRGGPGQRGRPAPVTTPVSRAFPSKSGCRGDGRRSPWSPPLPLPAAGPPRSRLRRV